MAQLRPQRHRPPRTVAAPAAPGAGVSRTRRAAGASRHRTRRRFALRRWYDASRKSTTSICAWSPAPAPTAASPRKTFCSYLATPPLRPRRSPQAAARTAAGGAAAARGEVVPLTRMRAIIAQRMVESKRISPHVYTVYKIDMTRIVRLRERERAGFEQRHGVKLTYMPFIATAAVAALRKFPIVNASLVGNAIHYHANINLGIAVALEWGLIVPVVRAGGDSAASPTWPAPSPTWPSARAPRSSSPKKSADSTFTLTNSGVFGGEFGTPIINQPESAILAIGGLNKEPVVLTDAEGNDTIAIRSMQHFCLGFDHRLIDGADAGKFMLEFKAAGELG